MPANKPVSRPAMKPAQPGDGTSQLLRSGAAILTAGLAAMAALFALFGGVGVEGAHNNLGWLCLIVGAMCLPFGLMLFALGAAKWLRNRSISHKR